MSSAGTGSETTGRRYDLLPEASVFKRVTFPMRLRALCRPESDGLFERSAYPRPVVQNASLELQTVVELLH